MKYYLDKNQIERLASNGDVYIRGKKYFKEDRVAEVVFFQEEGCGVINAKVYGNYSDYKVTAEFDEAGLLKKYGCTCEAHGIWRGCCKHVVALLLKVFELNKQSAVLSRNMRVSKNLLNIFERLTYDGIESGLSSQAEPINTACLEPVFCSDEYGECFLTFKIGRAKKYVIRNIGDFLENLKNERVVSYGKDFEFRHKISSFDSRSAKLAQFIIDENDRFERVSTILKSNYYYGGSWLNSRKMALTPSGIDAFFDLYKEQEISASFINSDVCSVRLTEQKPAPQFELAQKENGFVLSLVQNDYNVFKGEKGNYVLSGGVLHYINLKMSSVVLPIFDVFEELKGKEIYFSEKEKNQLSAFLIPNLRKYGLLIETDEIKLAYERPELKKKVYLDIEKNIVLCKALLCYGETELELDDLSRQAEIGGARDIVGEYSFKAQLFRMGFVFSDKHGQFTLTGDDAIYDFYYSENGLEQIKQTAEVFASEEFLRLATKPKTSTSVGVRLNGGLLEISVDTQGFSRTELLDVLQSYRIKKKYHRLKNGAFIDFSDNNEQLGAVDRLFNELLLSGKDIKNGVAAVPKYRALFADSVISESEKANIDISNDFRKLVSDFKTYKDLDFQVPKTLKKVLRGYQKEGFKWLKVLTYYGFGGILADDMGLGKTLEIIAVLLSEKGTHERPSIVVAPTSLIYNWEKEISRFAPELSSCIIAGAAAKRRELLENSGGADIFITTYDMLKRDIDAYKNIEFQFVIADEAQNIKNPTTQNAKAVKMLKGRTKFALTGTPIENSLSELWSIFDFIMQGYLYSAAKFGKIYEAPIVKNDDKTVAESLRKQIAPFILRRLKNDVLTELPQKIETTLYAEMPAEQKKLYTAYLLRAKGELEETIKGGAYNKSQIEILSKLTRLRQICCHPSVFAENYTGGSGKLDLTLDIVSSYLEAGHRILIFSQFTKMLAIIKDAFNKDGTSYYYLDGATPSKERLEMADGFNGGARDVFLISLKAGGTGLNLTGADVVLHYDPWWNPAVMEQAADRAHRYGQEKTVQVVNIVAKDTIEEKIMKLQEKKKRLVDTVIEEGASFINKMTEKDIVELFS